MKETITPSYAKELLKNNSFNRKIKEHHLRNLAYQMSSGQWVYNGEPIIIAKDGTILDGQHRLMAVALSEKTIEVYIVRDIEKDVMHTIDTGVTRTPADAIHLNGYDNSVALSKIIRMVILFRQKKMVTATRDRGQNVSNGDLLSFLKNEPSIQFALGNSGVSNLRATILSRSEIAFFWYIFKDIDESKANLFIDSLLSGKDLNEENPIFHLRNKLIADKIAKTTKLNYSIKMKLVFKAWDKFFKNQKVKLLSCKSDDELIFPTNYNKYY